jgi:competence protein ComEC
MSAYSLYVKYSNKMARKKLTDRLPPQNRRTFLKFIGGAVLWTFGCNGSGESLKSGATVQSFDNNQPSLIYTMVDVNKYSQGDAHLIRIQGGKTILIDTGSYENAGDRLIPYLQGEGVAFLDQVFITHPHYDHYEGLLNLMEDGISIGEVYFNLPTEEDCTRENWACDMETLDEITRKLDERTIYRYDLTENQKFSLGHDTSLEVLYCFKNNPSALPEGIERIDINDQSAIMLLRHADYKFLFTGDLNSTIGGWLAENGENLEAHMLKIPHHGASGIAPNSFFEKVNPQYAVVPVYASLWETDRCAQARIWLEDKGIPTYVNGYHGNVTVEIKNNGELNIQTEYNTLSGLCRARL